jgi:hypothetical protein
MQKSIFLFYVGLFLVLMNSVTLASFRIGATHVDEVSLGKTRYGNLGIIGRYRVPVLALWILILSVPIWSTHSDLR